MQKKIKKWEEAFKIKGLDPKVLPDVSMLPDEYRKPVVAQFILNVVADVLNDGWVADYTDSSQWKYHPYFLVKATKAKPSGSGLSYDVYVHWSTFTYCGVRLCYRDVETAEYAAKQFIKLYEDLYLKQ
jgi:hypothetical protein